MSHACVVMGSIVLIKRKEWWVSLTLTLSSCHRVWMTRHVPCLKQTVENASQDLCYIFLAGSYGSHLTKQMTEVNLTAAKENH
jgi:hypothetical protein